MQPAIEVQDLVKTYGSLRAVDGISFTVPPGQVFGLLGPNGAGKSTTIEMIEGLTEAMLAVQMVAVAATAELVARGQLHRGS